MVGGREVQTTYGKIKGKKEVSNNGRYYFAFEQIPYAAPPIGKNRFQPPKEPQKWEGILETQNITKVCVQNLQKRSIQNILSFITEDCLYLNVYTPVIPKRYKHGLPVLFWIYGGVYQYGASVFYGPQILMDSNIILVTFNYRVGPFGFLTTNDEIIPANLGLKDQHLALKWVAKNIQYFGGDPKKVTIGGQGAGGTSVSHQLFAKQNKGLFSAAIIQSGSSLIPTLFQPYPSKYAYAMGSLLNRRFKSDNSSQLLKILQRASTTKILAASFKVTKNTMNNVSTLFDHYPWTPTIESADIEGALITKPIHETMMRGEFFRIPVLIGITSLEYVPFGGKEDEMIELENRADSNNSLLVDYRLNLLSQDVRKMAQEIKDIYIKRSFKRERKQLAKFLSDSTFEIPILRQSTLYSKYNPVYLYKFSYKSLFSYTNFFGVDEIDQGVTHTEELHYIFFYQVFSVLNQFFEKDRLTRDRLLRIWTNFIRYQNPTPEKDPLLQNLTWPKLDPYKDVLYFNINNTLSIDDDLYNYPVVRNVMLRYIKPPYWVF